MTSKAQKAVDVAIQAAKDAVITAAVTAVTDPQHALPTAFAAGGVSGLWGLLGALSGKDKKRMDDFCNDLLLTLKQLPEEKLLAILDEAPYRALIRKVILAVYQEYNDEKIQCFRRLLVNVAHDQSSDRDIIHHLEGILERLSVFHIRVLRVLWNPGLAVRGAGLSEKPSSQRPPTTLDDKVTACFPLSQRDVILSALIETQVWNLTKERAGNTRIMKHTLLSFTQQKHLSPLGEKLVYLILSDSDAVEFSK